MFDVAIATSTYFGTYGNVPDHGYRYGLFEQMMESLSQIDTFGKDVCWVVHDDASPKLPPISTRMRFPVHLLRRIENIGQPKNYLSTVNHARELGRWVLVVDDDGRIAPDCLQRLFQLTEKYPNADCYGAFNSPYHLSEHVFSDHVLKHSTCEHGRFFRSSWSGFGETPHLIPVLRPSAIQHCGKYGLNGTEDDYDREFREQAAISAG